MNRDLEVFLCEPLNCKLTRKACASRFRTATAKDATFRWKSSECNGCPVGRAHAGKEAVVPASVTPPTPKKEVEMTTSESAVEFIRNHPSCTTRDVAEGIGSPSRNAAGTMLANLERKGIITSTLEGRSKLWTVAAGVKPAPAPGIAGADGRFVVDDVAPPEPEPEPKETRFLAVQLLEAAGFTISRAVPTPNGLAVFIESAHAQRPRRVHRK